MLQVKALTVGTSEECSHTKPTPKIEMQKQQEFFPQCFWGNSGRVHKPHPLQV